MTTELEEPHRKTDVKSGRLANPIRRHPECVNTDCKSCLEDHHYLGLFIGLRCGNSLLIDWLGEYRRWLDNKGIPAELNGWASRQAFDEKNILAFIEEWKT